MLKGCPSLLYLDMKGTVLKSSHDIELYRHPGVRHLESLLCSTVSPDPAKPYSQSLLIHFPNLEIWHFGGGKGLEIPFDKLKDGLANRCPKLRAVVTLLTPVAIVQYLLIHVFKRLTDIFLRYQELTPELIHAVLLHQRTLKAFRVMKYFNLLHEENDHVRENGWILQAILCHCLNLEVFDFEMYEMDMDDVERTEWKCRNLRELHVRIRGIDTREKVFTVIARLKEGRIAKTKASALSSTVGIASGTGASNGEKPTCPSRPGS
ncbi:hypothetical protein BGZ50_003801 [Haplosporangium sp. Z 11]|nr:hypothetical protein BGZ50_003801 [Haplosporangium sp. Z 11]